MTKLATYIPSTRPRVASLINPNLYPLSRLRSSAHWTQAKSLPARCSRPPATLWSAPILGVGLRILVRIVMVLVLMLREGVCLPPFGTLMVFVSVRPLPHRTDKFIPVYLHTVHG